MDDMNLFDRFHAAFDVAPPAGGFDRLRRELSNHRPDRRGRPAFHVRWNKMGIRLAAVVAVAVITITLVAAYLAGHRILTAGVPAGSTESVAAYLAMVDSDSNRELNAVYCGSMTDPGCSTLLANEIADLQAWRGDLLKFRTPNQFAVIDRQMQRHLVAETKDLQVAQTALSAGTSDLFISALYYSGAIEWHWLKAVVQGVAASHVATASQYAALTQAEHSTLQAGCSNCRQEAALLADCVSIRDPLCPHDVSIASGVIGTLQSDFVTTVAPSDFSDKYTTLQTDLAQADDALMAMIDALLQGDARTLASARSAYLDAVVAVEDDLQS